ncbi:STAS domain-containing protein [Cellulomonas sp. S1-8]|uniref:STAS domain-containing protein n=1 Tax=Cellulomonas sp. S1-8 TaxID=2904790 RepID=UPI002242D55E|nr:STAS domain-containing protein [Cellulomonas sp. S1-8]UZN03947.1 STAS domain-containing protein [Cellulomonas sp. S1-8]
MPSYASLPGSVTVEPHGSVTLVRLRGEIDISLRDQASSALPRLLDPRLPVEVDLAEVRLLSATGLSFLVQCKDACTRAGLSCVLRGVPAHVAVVLAAAELTAYLGDDDRHGRVSS